MKAIMELPVAKQGFGGIVGSRIEIIRPGREVVVQIAYLEKGETARVRYTEKRFTMETDQPARALELKLADVQIIGGDLKVTKLELDIICVGEK